MGYLGIFLGKDLTDGLGTNLAPRPLPFSKASFTNASPRHVRVGTRLDGPFSGGTLATVVAGGKRFAQLEASRATENTYSEVFRAAISDWINTNCTINDNAINDPLGNATADKVVENSDVASQHFIRHIITPDGSSDYCVAFFVKAAERQAFRVTSGGGYAIDCCFRLDTGVSYSASGTNYELVVPLNDGWYLCAVGVTSTAAAATGHNIYLLESPGDTIPTYDGDGSSGLYIWGANIIKAPYLTSYIPTVAAPVTRTKDQFKWAEANVPSWLRAGFKTRLIMHQGTDDMLASDGGSKYLFAFNATAEVISCYFDGADKKIKWAGSVAGALGESVALNWSIDDQIDIEFTFDNGANSTLKVTGGGVDTTYTGTSTAAIDGDVYWGMDTAEANQLDLALISEPEFL